MFLLHETSCRQNIRESTELPSLEEFIFIPLLKKIPLGRVYFWLTKRARGHSSAKYIFARFARCILVCFQKYICG